MGRLFISYRRQDSEWAARVVCDELSDHFGKESVFMDIDTLAPGDDFVEAIERAVGNCHALVALIGPQWLNIRSPSGARRLDEPNDFVRLEIGAALKRNVGVIPVLLGNAPMPRADELPPEIAALTRRQALEITPKRAKSDTALLIAAIERAISKAQEHSPHSPAAEQAKPPPSPVLAEVIESPPARPLAKATELPNPAEAGSTRASIRPAAFPVQLVRLLMAIGVAALLHLLGEAVYDLVSHQSVPASPTLSQGPPAPTLAFGLGQSNLTVALAQETTLPESTTAEAPTEALPAAEPPAAEAAPAEAPPQGLPNESWPGKYTFAFILWGAISGAGWGAGAWLITWAPFSVWQRAGLMLAGLATCTLSGWLLYDFPTSLAVEMPHWSAVGVVAGFVFGVQVIVLALTIKKPGVLLMLPVVLAMGGAGYALLFRIFNPETQLGIHLLILDAISVALYGPATFLAASFPVALALTQGLGPGAKWEAE